MLRLMFLASPSYGVALGARQATGLRLTGTPSLGVLSSSLLSRSWSSRMMCSLPKDEEGWRTVLSPNQFAVLREAATEPAMYSEKTPGELEYALKDEHGTKYPADGAYACVGCGAPLYYARSKFNSGCGWPAFYDGVPGAIEERPDVDGMRIEIVCAKCKGHLGHVFKGEGFPTPTNERHCVNGICLRYEPSLDQPDDVKAVPALTSRDIPA